jgi:hypothetical protein
VKVEDAPGNGRSDRAWVGSASWAASATAPSLVQWAAVFAGAIVALAIATMVSLLWLALGYSSHHRLFYQHLDWWIAGTAIGAMFLAGLIAGAASGTRGVASGLANGITTWALLVLGLLAAGIPGLVASGNRVSLHLGAHSVTVNTANWWPAFWAVVIGFGAAVIGGLLGGGMRRRPAANTAPGATTAPAAYTYGGREDPSPAATAGTGLETGRVEGERAEEGAEPPATSPPGAESRMSTGTGPDANDTSNESEDRPADPEANR